MNGRQVCACACHAELHHGGLYFLRIIIVKQNFGLDVTYAHTHTHSWCNAPVARVRAHRRAYRSRSGVCTSAPPVGEHIRFYNFFFVTFFALPITRSTVRDSLLIVHARARCTGIHEETACMVYVSAWATLSASMAIIQLGLAPKTIKYLMFAFNLLFVVSTCI